MRLTIAGRDVEIVGDESDPYFQTVHIHAQDFEGLVAVAGRLDDGAVIYDVGANIGLSAIALALAAPTATIYAFEPSPRNTPYLRQNVAPFPSIRVVEAAASDQPSTLRFHVSYFGAGSHVVGANHPAGGMGATDVAAIRLDDHAAEHGLMPALIKLDVEGHEPEALAGARRILSAGRPWVHMEFNTFTLNAYAGHSPAAFAQALWRAYDVEVLPKPKPDALTFLHDHFVHEQCIADLVMRPKAGVELPGLEEMSFPPAALDAIRAAGRERPPEDAS